MENFVVIGAAILGGVLSVSAFGLLYMDANPLGIILIPFGILMFLIAIFAPAWFQKQRIMKAEAIFQAEAKKREAEIIDGRWTFPAKEFYLECAASNATSLDNEFSIAKATKIAEQLIRQYSRKIELEKCAAYLNLEQLEKYMKEGKILEEKAQEEKLRKIRQPKDASPTGSELTFLQRSTELSAVFGVIKRKVMLSNLHLDYRKKIRQLREGQEALKTLGMIYMDQQKKESSWALMGGIADGIAGPAAGLAVAADTMVNNARIREHNAAVRNAAMEIMSGVPSLEGDISSLEKERYKIWSELEKAEEKIVLSAPTQDEIWQNMRIGKASITKNPSGVLSVSLPVAFKGKFDINVPESVKMVVDGTLKGEVWFEDKLVGEVLFPLPIYGISCDMSEEMVLDGICGRSVEFNGKYELKIADKQNLWIMEY